MAYTLVDTPQELLVVEDLIKTHTGLFYADIESTGLQWWKDDIVLFQLKFDSHIFLIDVRKIGYELLGRLLIDLKGKNRVVFHNAKFDVKFLLFRTGVLLDLLYDTMVGEVILRSGIGKPYYSLVDLALKYADIFMEKESRMDFVNLPKDAPFTNSMLNYAALDVDVLDPIHKGQMSEAKEVKMEQVMDLDMDLLPVVVQMETTGIKLDRVEWLKLEEIAKTKHSKLTQEIKPYIADFATSIKSKKITNGLQLAEALSIPVKGKARRKSLEEITDLSCMRGWVIENFNIASSYQKKAVLNLMGIKVDSANKKVIGKHTDKEIVRKLIEISEVAKQISQYGESFLNEINPITGRIHTEYSTVGTQTGRFSSQKPNLQNVPSHGGYRECFIPSEGYVFIAADYSQQEYRLTGAVSGEPVIVKAYKDGSDMHTATASNFTGKPLNEITKDERSWGKTRNFEIIYGTTEWGLSKSLKCSPEEAKKVLEKYWKGYPRLSKFKERVEELILQVGFSCTPLGRRRYSTTKPTFGNPNQIGQWREAIKREGFNHIIQGGGADIIKIAMVNIFRKNPFGDKFRLILQIHDELLVEVHRSIINEAREFLVREMTNAEQPFLKDIPAAVDSDVKERWSK